MSSPFDIVFAYLLVESIREIYPNHDSIHLLCQFLHKPFMDLLLSIFDLWNPALLKIDFYHHDDLVNHPFILVTQHFIATKEL